MGTGAETLPPVVPGIAAPPRRRPSSAGVAGQKPAPCWAPCTSCWWSRWFCWISTVCRRWWKSCEPCQTLN